MEAILFPGFGRPGKIIASIGGLFSVNLTQTKSRHIFFAAEIVLRKGGRTRRKHRCKDSECNQQTEWNSWWTKKMAPRIWWKVRETKWYCEFFVKCMAVMESRKKLKHCAVLAFCCKFIEHSFILRPFLFYHVSKT